MVKRLWDYQVNAIIDVKLGDTDADSYKYELMTALLTRCKTIKKDKQDKNCHDPVCSLSERNTREGSPARSLAIGSSKKR